MNVHSVHRDDRHRFSKQTVPSVTLVEGLGIEGDAHAGATVRHRSRRARTPASPNLRQVHLIHHELLDDLQDSGYAVAAGQLGENVTTTGIDLLGLPTGALLRLGGSAVVEITGLRNPCRQIETFATGLLAEVLGRDADGTVVRRTGVMAVVHAGGTVVAGDEIVVELPEAPYTRLAVV